MGEKHTVRFAPVGIEIEVDEDETVLNGAFRQGIMLMHGCKEGQCAACKSFLLDGEVDLDRYSTFALNDFEQEEGWTLLCRAHAYSDLEVELINYDEEIIRSGLPVQTLDARVETVEALTHDISRLVLALDDEAEFSFRPGQYVDLLIPGDEDAHRSFSMANLPQGAPAQLEFMIKRYPGGRFSGLLEGDIAPGDTLTFRGPYGVFTLRKSSERSLVFIGGGAGMAPILSLLRSMADAGIDRPARFYYGARRTHDLFHLPELAALEERLEGLRFIPALSEPADDEGWEGETGLITDVVDRCEGDLSEVDAYLCGPPPMVDAATELLLRKGTDESHIYFDKFTTTADSEESTRT